MTFEVDEVRTMRWDVASSRELASLRLEEGMADALSSYRFDAAQLDVLDDLIFHGPRRRMALADSRLLFGTNKPPDFGS